MDKTVILQGMAEAIGANILIREFTESSKHPVEEWCYELDIDKLFEEENEYAILVKENISDFMQFLNNTIEHKLKYLYTEGFLRKENDYYYTLSQKEIEESIEQL